MKGKGPTIKGTKGQAVAVSVPELSSGHVMSCEQLRCGPEATHSPANALTS